MSTGDLSRFHVLDLSTHLPGPVASQLLMSLGGEVVKLERPGAGDGNRATSVPDHVAPHVWGESVYHLALNAGARSVSVDRASPHWSAVLGAAVRWADVVIVGGRRSDAERRGLDFETLRAINPRLVYLNITGYGDNGPWADIPAHGQNPDALAGLVQLETTPDDGVQTIPGWRPAGTTLAGLHGALGVMTALLRRERTGEAQMVGASMWRSAMWWMWRDMVAQANLGIGFREFSDFGSRYAIYRTADDRNLLIAPIERKFWESFCDVADLPGLRSSGDWSGEALYFGDTERPSAERAAIAAAIRARTLREWEDALGPRAVPFAPVLSFEDALASEHAAQSGVTRTVKYRGKDLKVPAVPLAIAGGPGVPSRPPPEVGEHTVEVLRELRLDAAASAAVTTPEGCVYVP